MTTRNGKAPLFPLGQVLATPGAIAALNDAQVSPSDLLYRHITGDWGELCDEDKHENEWSLHHESRIFSSYIISEGVKIWIITEADRSTTTLLLPQEY